MKPASTVLLVDDDPGLRSMLGLSLRDEGYVVIEAKDAEAALFELSNHAVDVALVDMRLPGMSGLDLCREIRRRGRTPVVAVTAQTDTSDIVSFLDAGADDYVTKPVDGQVLAARLRAVIRRTSGDLAPATSVRVGALIVHLPSGEVDRAGERLKLSAVEARILAALAERAGTVVGREELFERVWGRQRLDHLGLIDRHVARLRAKLKGDFGGEADIVSVADVGYRLAE
ncbi:MAG TPA: response regulator transcription factor [Acidimicrobiales bacterium]